MLRWELWWLPWQNVMCYRCIFVVHESVFKMAWMLLYEIRVLLSCAPHSSDITHFLQALQHNVAFSRLLLLILTTR